MTENKELSQEEALQKLALLPPKEQRLAHGVALWLNGYSISMSARVAKCPYTTLWLRLQQSNLMESDRSKFAAVAEAQAMDLAGEGHRLLREKLLNPDEKLSAPELNMIWGTAVDKITRLQQLGQREQDDSALENVLSKISSALEHKTIELKIEPTPPDAHAIDVTPEETD